MIKQIGLSGFLLLLIFFCFEMAGAFYMFRAMDNYRSPQLGGKTWVEYFHGK